MWVVVHVLVLVTGVKQSQLLVLRLSLEFDNILTREVSHQNPVAGGSNLSPKIALLGEV